MTQWVIIDDDPLRAQYLIDSIKQSTSDTPCDIFFIEASAAAGGNPRLYEPIRESGASIIVCKNADVLKTHIDAISGQAIVILDYNLGSLHSGLVPNESFLVSAIKDMMSQNKMVLTVLNSRVDISRAFLQAFPKHLHPRLLIDIGVVLDSNEEDAKTRRGELTKQANGLVAKARQKQNDLLAASDSLGTLFTILEQAPRSGEDPLAWFDVNTAHDSLGDMKKMHTAHIEAATGVFPFLRGNAHAAKCLLYSREGKITAITPEHKRHQVPLCAIGEVLKRAGVPKISYGDSNEETEVTLPVEPGIVFLLSIVKNLCPIEKAEIRTILCDKNHYVLVYKQESLREGAFDLLACVLDSSGGGTTATIDNMLCSRFDFRFATGFSKGFTVGVPQKVAYPYITESALGLYWRNLATNKYANGLSAPPC